MELLKLQTNVPEEIALKYSDGKEVEGRYGTQYFYSLMDGRGIYVEPAVNEMIKAKGLKPGQPFAICKSEVKNGAKKSIAWEVKPVYGANDDAGTTPEVTRALSVPAQSARPANGAVNPVRAVAASSPDNATPTQQTHGNTVLAIGLQTVDAIALVETYAKKRLGDNFEFTSEDIRALWISSLIEHSKGGSWRSN